MRIKEKKGLFYTLKLYLYEGSFFIKEILEISIELFFSIFYLLEKLRA